MTAIQSSTQQPREEQEAQIQLQTMNEFLAIIQDKQLEHSLLLSKQTSVTVENKKYTKRGLTSKQWRELNSLNNKMAKLPAGSDEQTDALIELRTKGAEFYFSIPADVFDRNYEKLSPIIEGNILKSNSGLSPDLDINELFNKYQEQVNRRLEKLK
jgi:hypothetical protein